METFLVWANIAHEQLGLVRAGRAEIAAADHDQRLPLLEKAETAPAMLAITAAVSAIDGFAAVVEAAGVGERPVTDEESRAAYVWETLRRGFEVGSKTNDWPTRLKELYKLRSHRAAGGLLHPGTVFGDPTDHPLIPGVAPARALYTLETAERSVDLMREIFSTCAGTPRPELIALKQRIDGLRSALEAS